MLSIARKDICFAADGRSATLVLPATKSGARNGGMESVVVNDPILVRLLMLVVRPLSPGDRITGVSMPRFRALFEAGVVALGLDPAFKPYSARRGGATADFRSHGNIGMTMVRGRWRDPRTARIYINLALQHLNETILNGEVENKLEQATTQYYMALRELLQ